MPTPGWSGSLSPLWTGLSPGVRCTEAAEAARTALEARISDQRAAYESYIPEEVTKLDAAILDIRGSSVLLVVAADIEAAEAALD